MARPFFGDFGKPKTFQLICQFVYNCTFTFYENIGDFLRFFKLLISHLFLIKFRTYKSRFCLYFRKNLRFFLFPDTIYDNEICPKLNFVKNQKNLQSGINENKKAVSLNKDPF